MVKKVCFVPLCNNNNINAPNKVFIYVPLQPEIRKLWCETVGCNKKLTSVHCFCCEDHFNLKEDVENFMQYQLMKCRLIMKKDVLPTKFIRKVSDDVDFTQVSVVDLQLENLKRKPFSCEGNMETQSEETALSSIITTGDASDGSTLPCLETNEVQPADITEFSNNYDIKNQHSEEEEDYEFYIKVQKIEVKRTCVVCKQMRVAKYHCNNTFTGSTYICADYCLDFFKKSHKNIFIHEYFPKFYIASSAISGKFRRTCMECGLGITSATQGVCYWAAMEFCKDSCLYRFQTTIGKQCAECNSPVQFKHLGRYCVRFGSIIRQFCGSRCIEIRKKIILICFYCQRSINRSISSIGKKFFCHDICKGKYQSLQTPKKIPFLINPKDAMCFVCKNEQIELEFQYHTHNYHFCGMACFTIFKFVQNCQEVKKCHTCHKYLLQEYLEENAMYYENAIHYFCTDTCKFIYVITHRKVIACSWCKVKKYNFDMIQKKKFLNNSLHICSLYCLKQILKNVENIMFQRKLCYMCNKENGIYDIRKTDGLLSPFCSASCITKFNIQKIPLPTPPPKRTRRVKAVLPDKPGPLPIITNVCSLAQLKNMPLPTEPQIKKIVIVIPQPITMQRNVMTMASPLKIDQMCQNLIEKVNINSQTDFEDKGIDVQPILVPIYLPNPINLWKAPVPHPVPFPLFIPCPILIPLTIGGSKHVFNEITKVEQVKGPDDPFEAELLMMAELVATEKKEEGSHVCDDNDNEGIDGDGISQDTSGSNNTFGDDMLQMALKMASDYEEAPVDLEGALTANTITPITVAAETRDSDDDDLSPMEPVIHKNFRGRRRGSGRGRGSRRGRRILEIVTVQSEEPEEEVVTYEEPMEKPDANMCLKYTFGVNAWKQWVQTKNNELERTTRRPKLFKTELLQLTADELNYSLCLFMKEVKKPNGADYAPDTIYYLCLGVQQYLYENGRIDNIFCDPYYEGFTDYLNEVCAKFTSIYNDSHYIVTRVEEEHLWESKQLGAHSPHVLLSTLMYFNTKHFNLTNVDEHMQLSFSHIMKHWKRSGNPPGGVSKSSATPRNVLLRFYPPQSSDASLKKKKVYEQEENEENPLRCPVKLYEFYLSKCPESVKTRNDVFYLQPERSCVPDSPVWYSTMALESATLQKMMHRVKMVKEINVALLTN